MRDLLQGLVGSLGIHGRASPYSMMPIHDRDTAFRNQTSAAAAKLQSGGASFTKI